MTDIADRPQQLLGKPTSLVEPFAQNGTVPLELPSRAGVSIIVPVAGTTTVRGLFGTRELSPLSVLVLTPSEPVVVSGDAQGRVLGFFVANGLAADLMAWGLGLPGGDQVLRTMQDDVERCWVGILPPATHQALVALLSQSLSEGASRPWQELQLVARAFSLIGKLLSSSLAGEDVALAPSAAIIAPGVRRPLSRDVAQAKRILDTEYASQLTIAELAVRIRVSTSTLTRSFKRQIGLTPKEYLLQLRTDQFERLLAESGHSIKEAARISGFASLGNLRRRIKDVHGVSARVLRRGHSGQDDIPRGLST